MLSRKVIVVASIVSVVRVDANGGHSSQNLGFMSDFNFAKMLRRVDLDEGLTGASMILTANRQAKRELHFPRPFRIPEPP